MHECSVVNVAYIVFLGIYSVEGGTNRAAKHDIAEESSRAGIDRASIVDNIVDKAFLVSYCRQACITVDNKIKNKNKNNSEERRLKYLRFSLYEEMLIVS